jgi:chromosome segregation ATPase
MGKNIEFNELDYQMCAMWHAPNTTSVERAELSAMRLDLLSARVRMMSGTLTQEQEDALRAKILGSMRPVEFSLQLEGLREDVDNLVLHLEDVDRRLAEIEASLATLQNQVAKLGGEIHLLEEKVKAGDKKLETKLNVLREEMNGKFVEIFALIKELQRNALTVPTLQRPSG